MSLPPAVHDTFGGIKEQLVLCLCIWFSVMHFTSSHKGQWTMEIQYKFTDRCSRAMGAHRTPPFVHQSCVHVATLSVRNVLGRTGGTIGRAGVRRCTGLLLVLWCAVCLEGRHGH